MINGVWIIKKEVGICIFSHFLGIKEVDPQLFSGFLSSIYTFSEGISKTGGIETLELKDMKLIYTVFSNLIFIISVTKDEEPEIIRQKISEISSAFIERYKNNLLNWNGDLEIFEPFRKDAKLILEKSRTVEVEEIPIKLPEKKRFKLTTEEFEILSVCDGKTNINKIANKLNISKFKLMLILKSLMKKNIIEIKKILKSQ